MGRVLSNGTTLSFAREASPGVLPGSPAWFELEPNGITAWGTTIAKEARNPISQARGRRKGVVTDLDSTVEFEADLTLSHLRYFMEAFLFARARGGDVFYPTAATGTGYTIPALDLNQGNRLRYSGAGAGAVSLVYVTGFANEQNNGLKPLVDDPVGADTELTMGGLVAEVPDPTTYVEIAVAGIRGAAGDLKINADGDLTSVALDFTVLGLVVGQVIHIGGVDLTHQFFEEDNFGFARIELIAANKLTLAKRDQPFVVDDGTVNNAGGAGVRIDILFGQFVRNVRVTSGDYREISHQFEVASPNLMSNGDTGYEYSLGNYADALSISIPLTGKATMTFGFVGLDTTRPSADRALDADSAKFAGHVESFGSASDIARLRVEDADEEGLTTDFKTATLTLTNNVSAEKVIGKLGAKYLNAGDVEADVEAQTLFTNPDVIERIRCNRTVGLDWVLRNGDGGVAFDFPTGTLSGGNREMPENQSVLINMPFAAHEEPPYNFTLGVSFFPVLPDVGCA